METVVKSVARQVHLAVERCEPREVPAFLPPVASTGGGVNFAVADFNRDGRSDVAVITAKDTVTVRLSNGDGTFSQSVVLTGAQGDLYALDASDVNGDGKADVSVSGTGKLLSVTLGGWWNSYRGIVYTSVWLGQGDGTFGRPAMKSKSTGTLLGGWGPPNYFSIPTGATADFNGDGIRDHASIYLNDDSDVIYLQLANADGTLGVPLEYHAGTNPDALSGGDFNGDGRPDLILMSSISSAAPTISVLLNDGTW